LLSKDWAVALQLPAEPGLLIQAVGNGSPAERAGLRGANRRVQVGNYLVNWGGDFITRVDGKPIQSSDDIYRAANAKHAGESIELTIVRGGRTSTVKITLEALDSGV
jgi:S1-C subfamily serine protease